MILLLTPAMVLLFRVIAIPLLPVYLKWVIVPVTATGYIFSEVVVGFVFTQNPRIAHFQRKDSATELDIIFYDINNEGIIFPVPPASTEFARIGTGIVRVHLGASNIVVLPITVLQP